MALQRQSRKPNAERARQYGHLAAVVAARRQELRLSQAELGDLAGVSYRIVHHLESGRTGTSLERVIAVLDTLGLHLAVELGGAAQVRVGSDLARQFHLDDHEADAPVEGTDS